MNPARASKCPVCQSKKIVYPAQGRVAVHCYACGFERWKTIPGKGIEKQPLENSLGVLSKASADKLEQTTREMRVQRNARHLE